MKKIKLIFLATVTLLLISLYAKAVSVSSNQYVEITGELRQWHDIVLTIDGPNTSETANPNPFLYYRMDVTFSHGGKEIVVPGYFAADGDAANTSASSGNKWQTHLCPDEVGLWNYTISFRQGNNVSISDNPLDY